MTVADDKLVPALARGLDRLGLECDERQRRQLLDYLRQLEKWNRAYNLSGIKDIGQMLPLHLFDSLALHPFLAGSCIADVGTGAGLPGVPLAICNPDKRFILIDSNSKKTRFIFQTAALLGLENLSVQHCRVQDYASPAQVDIVTSRAFASLSDFVTRCRHLIDAGGRLLAMKGQYPAQEVAQLPAGFRLERSHVLQVPDVEGERHLLDIRLC